MILDKTEIAAVIDATADKDGDVAADALWQAARSPNHPLHDRYPWDERTAAIEHWRAISRKLIASCRVDIVVRDVTYSVPRYVRDPDKPADEQGYVAVERLRTDAKRASAALDAELRRIELACERAAALAGAFNLQRRFRAAIRRVLEMALAERRA